MNYKEYKQMKTCDNSNAQMPSSNPFEITSRETYLKVKEAASKYECNPINFEYTAEDYELFEKHFEDAMDQLSYTDEDFEISEWEEMVNMINANHPEYGVTVDILKKRARDRFEDCMNAGSPYYCTTSGFIKVEIGLYGGHWVEISFDGADACGCTEEDE